MKLRRFNAAGTRAFRTFLTDGRENPLLTVPWELLEDATLTETVRPDIDVQQVVFGSKPEAADYLRDRLAPLSDPSVERDAGLWTWLSLFFFDSVCPLTERGRRVKSLEFYIFEPWNSQRGYYHLLFGLWRVRQITREHGRLFMLGPVSVQDEVTREVMKRLFLVRIPCIFEVLDRLYWDESRGGARRGIVPKDQPRPGDLRHRLPRRIRQLEMTFDLQSLNADQLIELLGTEFEFDQPTELAEATA